MLILFSHSLVYTGQPIGLPWAAYHHKIAFILKILFSAEKEKMPPHFYTVDAKLFVPIP